MLAWLLCISIILTFLPTSVLAADPYTVSFVNYDLTSLNDTLTGVPEGARLYTADKLADVDGFSPESGCTWYLYLEGGEKGDYGPKAIHDPPEREGYTFQDWAAQNAEDDGLYTVTGDTTFVARYSSQGQYVINLYYQFDNDTHTVAAETTTVPYGLNAEISMALPQESLEGLAPEIKTDSTDTAVQGAVSALNQMIRDSVFTGLLDDTFLKNCLDAGFVAWDDKTGDYARDENGNVQISIPITYSVVGEISYQVEYYQQNPDDDGYTQVGETLSRTVTGTTHVNLTELGLVKQYAGFTLAAGSAENAVSYTVSTKGDTVIRLYYDRATYYIYYQMNGGNVRDPVQLRYGQSIPDSVTEEPTRAGYEFKNWSWSQNDGTPLSGVPEEMPNYDITLSANWEGANTTVTLVYWLENANDENYTAAGQSTITVPSGKTVGYDVGEGGVSQVDVAINQYVRADYVRNFIPDIDYFTFHQADSSTAYGNDHTEGAPKVAEGDGSTVINIGYTRNQYTLVFHLGQISDFGQEQISTGGNSGEAVWGTNDPDDWQSGNFQWKTVTGASLTMNGKTYHISNQEDQCYQIKAKYGAYISEQWPVASEANTTAVTAGDGKTYELYTWGTHEASEYYQKPNKNIIGTYATMSKELIIEAADPSVKHHLVAYWNAGGNSKTYHIMFEAVNGTEAGQPFSSFSVGSAVESSPEGGWGAVSGLEFYEFATYEEIRTNAAADAQNAPAYANVTYRYGGYDPSHSNDIYFFYTYTDYTLTYHENNENQQTDLEEITRTVHFHYIDGVPVAEQIEDANYVPTRPYVSSYGNEYTFLGWYTSNLTADATDNDRFAVDWDNFAPDTDIHLYAAWAPPDFILTLIVPDGQLYEASLTQFEEKGYTVELQAGQPAGGNTYVISGIPGGTPSNQIIQNRRGAENVYGLAFNYWSYEVDGQQRQYLFDASQIVTGNLTLTAQWKTEHTGQYVVRYLTAENPNNGLETVTLDGTTYYRLQADETVTNVTVGSSVTVEAAAIPGYLSSQGSITQTVEAPETQGGESKTYFHFIYVKFTNDVTYTVHYVRDTGHAYGRTEPPADAVFLAADKTVTVQASTLNDSTTVSEAAVMVGGYTPRDSWNMNFTLSADSAQNHFYIYYVSNTYEVDFSVTYHFMGEDGNYGTAETDTFLLNGRDALGKTIYAAELVGGYGMYLEDGSEAVARLKEMMAGHVLDEALTQPSILLRRQTPTQEGQTANVLHIYMKNGSYTITYDLNDGGGHDASWDDADRFLTGSGTIYSQSVTYPAAAGVPTTEPVRRAYAFTGWNTQRDGGGTAYEADSLHTAPWYQRGGLYEDVTLYAQWEPKLTVSFDLRGGTWTDSGGDFYQQAGGIWQAYVAQGQTAPLPQDPTLVTAEGMAYSFVGWTAQNPDEWQFTTGENQIDLAAFERYRYRFDRPLTESVTLYAVWDPDVNTFGVYKTDADQADPVPLAGAAFTLERLLADVTGNSSGGYDYTLRTDENGAYLTDGSFAGRTLTSGADGRLVFENLPAGYYRLTETAHPAGYTGLSAPVILYAPYKGEAWIYDPGENSGQVEGTTTEGELTVTVRNVSQYSVSIDAPDSITFVYTAPDFIWNPELLVYERVDGTQGTWQASAVPEGKEAEITVSNTSQGQNQLDVEVTLTYQEGYEVLLPLSTLSSGADGYTQTETTQSKTLTGTLAAESSATFSLTLAGMVPLDAVLPREETQVGTISVRVTKSSG